MGAICPMRSAMLMFALLLRLVDQTWIVLPSMFVCHTPYAVACQPAW
jgi:hypothetical protein